MRDTILTILTLAFMATVLAASIKLAFFPNPIDKQIDEVEEVLVMQFSETEQQLLSTSSDIEEIKATIDSMMVKLEELEAERMN